ncbi:hypothetical protein WN51_12305 [Melipona quadrifasciata]|uniref:Uncharacterized protein n=1 Tax=Melipona quadrifasciata TaxID=166423 RepID=A0A0M9ABT2_9HYME|nr:hypothetical protein WN51_12305 [Melipona quadrifasciata]
MSMTNLHKVLKMGKVQSRITRDIEITRRALFCDKCSSTKQLRKVMMNLLKDPDNCGKRKKLWTTAVPNVLASNSSFTARQIAEEDGCIKCQGCSTSFKESRTFETRILVEAKA